MHLNRKSLRKVQVRTVLSLNWERCLTCCWGNKRQAGLKDRGDRYLFHGITKSVIRIKWQRDRFLVTFIASDAALDSKWCNWEIGFGDAHKYEHDKIAIFPVRQDDRQWSGNEYLQLYPSIEYFDGTTTYKNGEIIPKGYYVYYHYENRIMPLDKWISK